MRFIAPVQQHSAQPGSQGAFDILLAQVTGSGDDTRGNGDNGAMSTEAAIRNDPRLSDNQKAALLSVYQSMVTEH